MPERKLLLVDGINVLYRAYFAIQGLSTRSGRPTNAVFGFIRMLRQMDRLWQPTHWAVVLDGGVPAERLARLPEYKANRPPMPDALREQIPPMQLYLDASRIPALCLEGLEADDVLASLAVQRKSEFAEVLVATSDKDLFQVVDESIHVIPVTKADRRMGPEAVLEKTGVRPERIAEWLALTGDTVDNIPGVPGFGPKTAAELLATEESLAGVLEAPDRVKSDRLRGRLVEHRDQIARNLDVTRLRLDVPGLPTSEELERRPGDEARLLQFFREMEFHSMADELQTASLF